MLKIDTLSIRQGDRLALSRALTLIENNTSESHNLQSALFPFTGHAHLIGITGAPGTGKSTLVNQLAKTFRTSNFENPAPKVAIIAVDPSSPFTGGALLGDRVRMGDLSGDKGIFIRSMASRGALGGLAHRTAAFVTLLDAAGFDLILIETVGAGQAEVDIANLAHTVLVVEAPGLGDDIQAFKAGILEIGDIIVVNKADRPGADQTIRALRVMLEMAHGRQNSSATKGKHVLNTMPAGDPYPKTDHNDEWLRPLRSTVAAEGVGIDLLAANIYEHKNYLHKSGLWQEKEANRLRRDLEALIQDKLIKSWEQELDQNRFESVLADVIHRKYSPIKAIDLLMKKKPLF